MPDAYRQRPNQTDQTLDDILVTTLIGGVAGFAVGLAVDSLVKRIETRRTVAAWMWTSLIAGWIAFTSIDSIVNSPVRE